ncbi:aminodeoxychorismate/anthranilate synthase component II [Candidatus Peregrinibacteria bacterium]|jgi:anthranilate synthase component II|nr:aminodeoxychorismate/anthranilate synthase component II [Candidatus Peregrinibacteria bacterium]
MKKTLIIDNYDSFTFNLHQFLGEIGGNPIVFRNDNITLEDIITLEPTHIVLSPGPGTAENDKDFGVCKDILAYITKGEGSAFAPLLGVCLGHQGIIKEFGGDIEQAPEIVHGKRSIIKHDGNSALFKGIPQEFEGMRYHSLIGTPSGKHLKITATLKNDHETIMAVEHISLPIYGIQFHPESIGTPEGKNILRNFLEI